MISNLESKHSDLILLASPEESLNQFLEVVEQERVQSKAAKGEMELLKKEHRELIAKNSTTEKELKAAREDRLSLNERLIELERSSREREMRAENEMQRERSRRI